MSAARCALCKLQRAQNFWPNTAATCAWKADRTLLAGRLPPSEDAEQGRSGRGVPKSDYGICPIGARPRRHRLQDVLSGPLDHRGGHRRGGCVYTYLDICSQDKQAYQCWLEPATNGANTL